MGSLGTRSVLLIKQYIGLDMSLTGTGVAVITGGLVDLYTIGTTAGQFNKLSKRVKYIVDKAMSHIDSNAQICIEEPFIHVKNIAHAPSLLGLAYKIREVLDDSNIPYNNVAPTQLKKFILGKGAGKKEQVMMKVLKNWQIEPRDNNQADALVLAKIAQALDKANVIPLKNYQEDVIDAIINPKGKKTVRKKRVRK